MSEDGKSVAERYAIEQVNHYKKKANHNKFESVWCFKTAMVCSLLCPLFVSLGEGLWLSKVIPSLLSAFAAFSTAWLQLRKPHALWAVYRTAQRKIETTLTHYQFRVGKFDGMSASLEEADKLLISEVTNLASEAHNSWAKNVPDTTSFNKMALTGKE
ncbi:DUF4231 domain-containing protein [Vibrio parahaemolyticus]|uniref:DUF4231 domain-containing protein n=1 Tax=Vibrio parahaemolyticus TaxID=670 RepID=UPI0004A32E76|nr:DUF4231 domain-containing protein [Vibrio parahaemolyticus]EGR2769637.1 DUF4231 domain-containing protein [Vibrio parahaemolyticus]EGR2834171.1 DUF4231 domain-containing protein [Vibrio parahaemolyticus]EGR2888640.1 DUF4231 domain-containing protein [Vibrio parahaemolyticus]EGR2907145.1 DUF4231 domain-containing protein [Vibrio parahaemolyticus]EGR2940849.1 DUF4231 domain-containing protein [Vibrio parahaemolyticus]